jgi:hypothetical protein
MARIRLPPTGFWSYVRRDDERSRGKISDLRDLVLAELETQIGGEVPVFKDTISIPRGVRWEELTTQALSDATFFIPILTPNFLKSEWCCREVRLFLERESKLLATYPDLPRRSRIYPIHYVDIDDADADDAFVRDAMLALQHFDFRRMRNLHYQEPEVRNSISEFVTDIRKLLRAWVEAPETAPPPEEPPPGEPPPEPHPAEPPPDEPPPEPHPPEPPPAKLTPAPKPPRKGAGARRNVKPVRTVKPAVPPLPEPPPENRVKPEDLERPPDPAPAETKRPIQVTLAGLALIAVSAFVTLGVTLLDAIRFEYDPLYYLLLLFFGLAGVALGSFILMGRNWARLGYAGWALSGFAIALTLGIVAGALLAGLAILGLIGLGLFAPPSQAFFAASADAEPGPGTMAAETAPRPIQVTVAASALILAAALLGGLPTWGIVSGQLYLPPGTSLLIPLTTVAGLLCGWFLLAGRRWARVAFPGLAALCVITAVLFGARQEELLAGMAALAAVGGALFLGPAQAYFSAEEP